MRCGGGGGGVRLWGGLALLGWACTLAGGHAPTTEYSGYSGYADERFASDTYTTANINITYEDEHGEIYTETSESGKYGEGFVGSAAGRAVHVRSVNDPHDHSGCAWPLLSSAPAGPELPDEPWIAVVRRGNCNFEMKVQNAWRANASAVLIYNDRDAAQLEKMKLSTDSGRNISAVFTFKWKGEEVTRLVENGTRVTLAIIRGRNCVRTYNNNINRCSRNVGSESEDPNTRTSVLFVSISFIVLMIISLAWLVFYYVQRFRYIHAKDRLSKRLCCAAKKALSRIPVKSLKTEDREVQGDGECCAVCIEPYKVSDTLRSLPCRHDFHKSCIDPWLLEHRTCPMCKMDILKYYGFVFTGSQESILQLEHEDSRVRAALAPVTHTLVVGSPDGYSVGSSERSSRASSPDELTPSLRAATPPSPAASPAAAPAAPAAHDKPTASHH